MILDFVLLFFFPSSLVFIVPFFWFSPGPVGGGKAPLTRLTAANEIKEEIGVEHVRSRYKVFQG